MPHNMLVTGLPRLSRLLQQILLPLDSLVLMLGKESFVSHNKMQGAGESRVGLWPLLTEVMYCMRSLLSSHGLHEKLTDVVCQLSWCS